MVCCHNYNRLSAVWLVNMTYCTAYKLVPWQTGFSCELVRSLSSIENSIYHDGCNFSCTVTLGAE